MFQALFPVARHTPLNVIITPNGERLSVIVIPKPSGDAADNPALAKPLSFVGTPDDLDREFPEQLRQYAEKVNDLRTALDVPLDALEEAKRKAAKKDTAKAEREKKKEQESKARSDAAKKAAETRAAKAEEKKRAREAANKKRLAARDDANRKRREARAQKADTGSASKITLPGATAPAKPATAKPTPASNKPGKPECIADYRALHKQFGDLLTRRGFIKQAKTGRRYEKLWKNWEDFIAEANQLALPLSARKTSEASPAPAAVAASAQPAASATPPPPPAAAAGAESAPASEPAAPRAPVWSIKGLDGATLGATTTEPKVGDVLQMMMHGAMKVLDVEGKEALVKKVGEFDPAKLPATPFLLAA